MKNIPAKSNKKIKASTSDIYDKIRGKVESYLDQKCIEDDSYDPLDYWKMAFKTDAPIDVQLSKIAGHYLTPPASSVDVERLFSTAADIITNNRGRLNPERAEKIFCRENFSLIQYQY